jgi:hypothetical protein
MEIMNHKPFAIALSLILVVNVLVLIIGGL